MPTIRAIVRDAEAHEYRMSTFVMGVITSAAFQQRSREVTETASQR
jgi:hypothetical protein